MSSKCVGASCPHVSFTLHTHPACAINHPRPSVLRLPFQPTDPCHTNCSLICKTVPITYISGSAKFLLVPPSNCLLPFLAAPAVTLFPTVLEVRSCPASRQRSNDYVPRYAGTPAPTPTSGTAGVRGPEQPPRRTVLPAVVLQSPAFSRASSVATEDPQFEAQKQQASAWLAMMPALLSMSLNVLPVLH